MLGPRATTSSGPNTSPRPPATRWRCGRCTPALAVDRAVRDLLGSQPQSSSGWKHRCSGCRRRLARVHIALERGVDGRAPRPSRVGRTHVALERPSATAAIIAKVGTRVYWTTRVVAASAAVRSPPANTVAPRACGSPRRRRQAVGHREASVARRRDRARRERRRTRAEVEESRRRRIACEIMRRELRKAKLMAVMRCRPMSGTRCKKSSRARLIRALRAHGRASDSTHTTPNLFANLRFYIVFWREISSSAVAWTLCVVVVVGDSWQTVRRRRRLVADDASERNKAKEPSKTVDILPTDPPPLDDAPPVTFDDEVPFPRGGGSALTPPSTAPSASALAENDSGLFDEGDAEPRRQAQARRRVRRRAARRARRGGRARARAPPARPRHRRARSARWSSASPTGSSCSCRVAARLVAGEASDELAELSPTAVDGARPALLQVGRCCASLPATAQQTAGGRRCRSRSASPPSRAPSSASRELPGRRARVGERAPRSRTAVMRPVVLRSAPRAAWGGSARTSASPPSPPAAARRSSSCASAATRRRRRCRTAPAEARGVCRRHARGRDGGGGAAQRPPRARRPVL